MAESNNNPFAKETGGDASAGAAPTPSPADTAQKAPAAPMENNVIFLEPIVDKLSWLQTALEKSGDTGVHLSKNEQEALTKAMTHNPSLVYVSILTPADFGKALGFMARASLLIKKKMMRVIVVSKVNDRKFVDTFLKQGATEFIMDTLPHNTLLFKTNVQLKALRAGKAKGKELNINTKDDKSKKLTEEGKVVVTGPEEAKVLDLGEDCWVFKGEKPRKVGAFWVSELEGPDPESGEWNQVGEDADKKPIWQWKPKNPDGSPPPMGKAREGWEFTGSKPVFDPEKKKWKMMSEKPDLTYKKNGKKLGSKLSVDAQGKIQVAKDSPQAEKNIEKSKELAKAARAHAAKVLAEKEAKAKAELERKAKAEAEKAKKEEEFKARQAANREAREKAQKEREKEEAEKKAELEKAASERRAAREKAVKEEEARQAAAKKPEREKKADEEDDEDEVRKLKTGGTSAAPKEADDDDKDPKAPTKKGSTDPKNPALKKSGAATEDNEDADEGRAARKATSGAPKKGKKSASGNDDDEGDDEDESAPEGRKKVKKRKGAADEDDSDEEDGLAGLFKKEKKAGKKKRKKTVKKKVKRTLANGQEIEEEVEVEEEVDEDESSEEEDPASPTSPRNAKKDRGSSTEAGPTEGDEADDSSDGQSDEKTAAKIGRGKGGAAASGPTLPASKKFAKDGPQGKAAKDLTLKEEQPDSYSGIVDEKEKRRSWRARTLEDGESVLDDGLDEEGRRKRREDKRKARKRNARRKADGAREGFVELPASELGSLLGIWKETPGNYEVLVTPEMKSATRDSLPGLAPFWYLEDGSARPRFNPVKKAWMFPPDRTPKKAETFDALPEPVRQFLLDLAGAESAAAAHDSSREELKQEMRSTLEQYDDLAGDGEPIEIDVAPDTDSEDDESAEDTASDSAGKGDEESGDPEDKDFGKNPFEKDPKVRGKSKNKGVKTGDKLPKDPEKIKAIEEAKKRRAEDQVKVKDFLERRKKEAEEKKRKREEEAAARKAAEAPESEDGASGKGDGDPDSELADDSEIDPDTGSPRAKRKKKGGADEDSENGLGWNKRDDGSDESGRKKRKKGGSEDSDSEEAESSKTVPRRFPQTTLAIGISDRLARFDTPAQVLNWIARDLAQYLSVSSVLIAFAPEGDAKRARIVASTDPIRPQGAPVSSSDLPLLHEAARTGGDPQTAENLGTLAQARALPAGKHLFIQWNRSAGSAATPDAPEIGLEAYLAAVGESVEHLVSFARAALRFEGGAPVSKKAA